MTDFVSLHNQSHFSILDALPSPKDLLLRAKELNQSALAITDHGSLASAWDAYKAYKEVGVKLIIGCEMYFVNDLHHKNEEKFKHIVLIAKNAEGYRNILTLNKKGYDNGAIFAKKVYPIIDWKLIEKYSEGVICLTACGNGIISQLLMQKKFQEAEDTLLKLKKIFNEDLGIEVQPNNLKRNANPYSEEIDQKFINHQLINLGKKLNIKIVPACNAHYLNKEDAETHDVLLAIGSHQPVYSNFRIKYSVSDFYLKSGDEVKAFFSRNYGEEFTEQICKNSVDFANKCENPDWIDPKYSNPSGKELPIFPVKDESDYDKFLSWLDSQEDSVKQLDEDKQYLRFKSEEAFSKLGLDKQGIEYRDRLEEELDVLYHCGVSSYMLIVADYVKWARSNGVSVGPGRGSVGGSLIAYLLDIHKADPIKYGLVFPRFHNKLKQSYSDIDLDFSKSGRHKVIEYITQKYGSDNVAQISNLMEMTPKVYARDVARTCELGGSREEAVKIGNAVADSIPTEISSINSAIETAPLFSEYCKKYPQYIKYKSLSNKYRSFGIHAAGIIIARRPLTGLVPMRTDKNGVISLEYDKDVAEENGLVKMDILGLSTLDIIDRTNEIIKLVGKEVPLVNYEEYDEATYNLISSGDTYGVFQFGTSAGTIDLCRKIKPKNIEDLAVVTTLARPASKDIREDFIKTRAGEKNIALMHNSLGRALNPTFGYPLYDESLLILAKDVAGWDLNDADKLRKLTKEKGKSPEKVKKWKQEFIEGAEKNGIRKEIVEKIWEHIIEPYGKYSFNKSHAVLYSMISYHTAYLKAHFPVEFLLANLMSEIGSNAPDADENIAKIKKEIIKNKVKILPPDLNRSQLSYALVGEGKLLTGLDALKFVSDEAIKDIIEKRPFKDFTDFMARVDSRKVRANTIQALTAAGCLDGFGFNRKTIYLYCSDFRKKLQVWMKKHDHTKETFEYPFPKEQEWNKQELYALEKEYLGESFTCKKKDAYGDFFHGEYVEFRDLKKIKKKVQVPSTKAEIVSIFTFKVKKEGSKFFGQEMAKVTMEDAHGTQMSITIFPDRLVDINKAIKNIYKNKVKFDVGTVVHFGGSASVYEEEVGIILDRVYDMRQPPQMPEDLKPRKISLRTKKENNSSSASGTPDLFTEMEDELINEGLLDLTLGEDD
jgi:DNA polymerase-3 subunit alpha